MTGGPPTPAPPTRCSDICRDIPLAGTAPVTERWWLIEHAGPWGSHAVRDATQPWISAGTDVHPDQARILLIRRHVRRMSEHQSQFRRIFTFAAGDDVVWGATLHINEAPSITDFGSVPDDMAWQPTRKHPRVVMCTNGRRDRCCAERARPILDALPPDVSEQVWECTHIGGHRFAPVALTIPRGIALGRTTVQGLIELVRENRLDVMSVRGRSDITAPEQAAEISARRHWSLFSVNTDLTIRAQPDQSDADKVTCNTIHPDGSEYRVTLTRRRTSDAPASCDQAAVPVTTWEESH